VLTNIVETVKEETRRVLVIKLDAVMVDISIVLPTIMDDALKDDTPNVKDTVAVEFKRVETRSVLAIILDAIILLLIIELAVTVEFINPIVNVEPENVDAVKLIVDPTVAMMVEVWRSELTFRVDASIVEASSVDIRLVQANMEEIFPTFVVTVEPVNVLTMIKELISIVDAVIEDVESVDASTVDTVNEDSISVLA
jgi:hypothetical protein